MHNENIDHKILAKHFGNTIQGMWRLKDKYKKTKTGLWAIYVKAYNWDLFAKGLEATHKPKPNTERE